MDDFERRVRQLLAWSTQLSLAPHDLEGQAAVAELRNDVRSLAADLAMPLSLSWLRHRETLPKALTLLKEIYEFGQIACEDEVHEFLKSVEQR